MPEADDRDPPGGRGAAELEIETAGDDAVALPVGEPRGIGIVLPAFGREDEPVGVEADVLADPAQDLPAVDLRRFDNQRNVRGAPGLPRCLRHYAQKYY